MDSNQIKQCKEFINNKELYIQLCKDENPELGSKVAYRFEKLTKLFPQYYSDILDSALASKNALNAHKAVKIDPYIAGGIGEGIAGVGAGISNAVSAAQRNQAIDEWRIESDRKSYEAKQKSANSDALFTAEYIELAKLINSSKNVRNYYLEQNYLLGKQFISSSRYLDALSCFEKTRNYKDTEVMIEDIHKWWEIEKKDIHNKERISVVVTVIAAIICILWFGSSVAAGTAVSDVRLILGFLFLCFGLFIEMPLLGSKSKEGILIGLFSMLGGMFMGIGSGPAKDAPNGSLGMVGFGLFLIWLSIAFACKVFRTNWKNKVQNINFKLKA